jgi:hypothetical protein
LDLHQFLRDVQDQLRWLQEKQRMAESDEVGQDLLGISKSNVLFLNLKFSFKFNKCKNWQKTKMEIHQIQQQIEFQV